MLAVSAPARVAAIDAPTLREQGIALDLANWRGVVAPPGLTDAERDTLTARVERMAPSAQWKAVLAQERMGGPAADRPGVPTVPARRAAAASTRCCADSSPRTRRARARVRLTPMTLPVVTLAALALLGLRSCAADV